MISSGQLQFGALPLHDAILKELRADWAARTCITEVLAFVDGLEKPAQLRWIVWNKTQEVGAPHRAPWGNSVHINTAREEDGHFIIAMQSGNRIRIAAENVEFRIAN
jgi:hypothetical protein